MSNHYPKIIIPKSISDSKEAIIPLPREPIKPVDLPPFENSNIGWYILLISLLFISNAPTISIIGIIVGFLFIKSNSEDKSKYKKDERAFLEKKAEYESNYRAFLREKESVLIKKNNILEVMKYRENKLKKTLLSTAKPQIIHSGLKGRAEEYFFSILNKYFHGNIITDRAIEYFPNSQAYLPDFIFFHQQSNLHIDIEIDEPYVNGIGQPIHYLDNDILSCSIDSARDAYFIGKGWVIIRFSEEQVCRFPEECCKVISNVIEDVIGNNYFTHKFVNIKNLPKIKRWTKEESIKMFIDNYRSQYTICMIANSIYQQGKDLYESKNYSSAINEFSKCIDLNINTSSCYYYRGICYYNVGKYEESILDFDKFSDIEPNNSKIYKLKADSYRILESYSLSIENYNKAISLNNESGLIYYFRSVCYEKLKDFQKSHEDMGRCISLVPKNSIYFNRIGYLKSILGDYVNAIKDIDKALEIRENDEIYLNNRGHFKYWIGDLDGAQEDFSRILNIDCSNESAIKNIEAVRNSRLLLKELERNDLFIHGVNYFSLGFNITCISNLVNKYNEGSKNIYKNPNHSWKYLLGTRQKYGELLMYEWSTAIGIGTVMGINKNMTIDIDGCNDFSIVMQIINLIGLPIEYEWVVRSGSRTGFHIIVKSDKFANLQNNDVVNSYIPNEKFRGKFDKIEFLWNTHLVLPPSLHNQGGKYEFVNTILPKRPPEFIDNILLKNVIDLFLELDQERIGKMYLIE